MSTQTPRRIRVVDSHTAGEPTRVVLEGGPQLGSGTVAEQARVLRQHHDRFRSAVIREPRGSDVLVGALLCQPADPTCTVGVIFFNNIGTLGMCGHGAIGVITTLAHLDRLSPGPHRLETPVGVVTTLLHPDRSVSVENVPGWREAHDVRLEVPGHGPLHGDVAWGGNWFFLTQDHGQKLERLRTEALTTLARQIRQAANKQGYPSVDHVELIAPPTRPDANARNFVLCPGGVYDRSPCGTGTCATLACLAADGELEENTPWVQEGILGSTFTGHFVWLDRTQGRIHPTIRGTAFVTGEGTLLLDERDPFCWGL